MDKEGNKGIGQMRSKTYFKHGLEKYRPSYGNTQITFQTEGGEIASRFAVVTARANMKPSELLNNQNFEITASLAGDQIKIWHYNTTATAGVVLLTDLSGKSLYTQVAQLSNTELSLDKALPSGCYLVSYKGNNGQATARFLVQ